MRRITAGIIAGASLIIASCGNTPARVSGLDATAIQSVSEDDLCFTYAMNLKKRQAAPNVDAEVKRRGLTCEYRKETIVSDCSMLSVVSSGRHPTYSNVTEVSVQNSSNKSKKFSISLGNIASSPFRIGPGETQSYGVVVSKEMAAAASITGAVQGLKPAPATLYNCFTDFAPWAR